MKRRLLYSMLAIAAVAFGLACSDNSESDQGPTEIPPTPQPTEIRGETEGGEAPVFWRAADDFESLIVEESYKVLFRITNGYEEPTLTIDAKQHDGDGDLVLTSDMAEPVGDDLPGAYYPTFLLFTSAGTWELTIHAGDDTASLTVEVAEAPS